MVRRASIFLAMANYFAELLASLSRDLSVCIPELLGFLSLFLAVSAICIPELLEVISAFLASHGRDVQPRYCITSFRLQ